MTAKRLFGVVKGHREHIVDHTGRLYSDNEVADLLNTIYEENEQLKIELEALRKKYNDFSDAVDKRLQEMDKRLLE